MRRPFGFEKRQGFPASVRQAIWGTKVARAKGDAARDRGEWAEAKIQYQRYLASYDKDAAIWVQLGHALKESGKLDEAEIAYRTALRLMPEDEDVRVHLNDVVKRLGRASDANSSSKAAGESGNRLSYLSALEVRADLSAKMFTPAATGCIYIPVNDLLYYLHHHATVSGIQRVQVNLLAYFLGLQDDPYCLRFVYTGLHGKDIWAIAPARIADLIGYLAESGADHSVIRRLIDAARETATRVEMKSVDTCFILGSFWDVGGNPALLREVKRKKAALGIYFYDLIPVTHREYVVHELSVGFSQALTEALSFIDFGLAISNYTAHEVRRFIAENGFREVPITTVKLAHALRHEVVPDKDIDGYWPDAITALRGEKFVLCVGTIEAKKNHRYLFDAWKALISEGVDPPLLLLVGRKGWLVSDFMGQLDATHYLDGRVKIIHDLSDNELAQLYKNCLFTIFPSVVEGWGLPVGESLSYGKLCVASSTTSVPEVGGDFVAYIDPWNLHDGVNVLRSLLTDPAELARREAAICTNFKPRVWADVGKDLLVSITEARLRVVPDERVFVPLLAPGELFLPAKFWLMSNTVFETARKRQQRLILTDEWDRAENWGCWMQGTTARLLFKSPLSPSTTVIVYLYLALTRATTDNELTITCPGALPLLVSLPKDRSRLTLRLETRTDSQSNISVQLSVSGPIAPIEGDGRRLRVGLSGLAHAATTDKASRAEILEALIIDTRHEA